MSAKGRRAMPASASQAQGKGKGKGGKGKGGKAGGKGKGKGKAHAHAMAETIKQEAGEVAAVAVADAVPIVEVPASSKRNGDVKTFQSRRASPRRAATQTQQRTARTPSRPKPNLRSSPRTASSGQTDLSKWSTLSPYLTKKCNSPSHIKKEASTVKKRGGTKGRASTRSARAPASTLPSRTASPTKIGADTHDAVYMPTEEERSLFLEAQELAQQRNAGQVANLATPGHRKIGVIESQLEAVVLGQWEIPVWYISAYPQEYQKQRRILLCQFCLQYFKTQDQLTRHMAQPLECHPPHPPGDEVYRKGDLSLWEIDGSKKKVYCQNLCLLSKLFLDSKTLWRDVEPFLFYVLTRWDEHGAHIIGYFSKEKASVLNYNLSCIMTLPTYQRRGYGQAMIELSYLLTRKEGKTGTPEKPLSDLGLISYRRFWTSAILDFLIEHEDDDTFSISDMSAETGIIPDDVVSTLQALRMVKAWRGVHVVVPREDLLKRHREQGKKGQRIIIDPNCLRWTPLIVSPKTSATT